MITEEKIEKQGIINYIIAFFKIHYKSYLKLVGIFNIPILIIYFTLLFLNDSDVTIFSFIITPYDQDYKGIYQLIALLFLIALNISCSIYFLKNYNTNLVQATKFILANVFPAILILTLGYVFFIGISLVGFVKLFTPISVFIFIFFGSLSLLLSFLYSVYYTANLKKTHNFIHILKTKTTSIFNALVLFLIFILFSNVIIPYLIYQINEFIYEILAIGLKYEIINSINQIIAILLNYVVVHAFILHFYMMIVGINDDLDGKNIGNEIDTIGNSETEEHDF
nr:hypothetical protein [uncultured Flavobacterium sp.]